jgi:putative ABC transport system substrate-binding protein
MAKKSQGIRGRRDGDPVKLKSALFLSIFLGFTGSQTAVAGKVYRISALVSEDFFMPAFEGFRAKMKEMGYAEGKNIQYDLRNARGDKDTLQKLAQTLIQDKPDLIVTSSTTATLPVAKATLGSRVPVVFLSAGNPLEFVKSYASSGNNITGITTATVDLTAKRLELLRELAPWVKRVASISSPHGVSYNDHLRAVREAAKKFALELWEINVSDRKEIEEISSTITRKVADAIFLAPDRLITGNIELFVKQSIREKLPLIPPPATHDSGGLATYGHDYYALGHQGASLVDKILRGAKPADLPIEQPSKLRLVINLKAANAIGLKVPKDILVRADEVIQ